jgi:hypothetical protein
VTNSVVDLAGEARRPARGAAGRDRARGRRMAHARRLGVVRAERALNALTSSPGWDSSLKARSSRDVQQTRRALLPKSSTGAVGRPCARPRHDADPAVAAAVLDHPLGLGVPTPRARNRRHAADNALRGSLFSRGSRSSSLSDGGSCQMRQRGGCRVLISRPGTARVGNGHRAASA